MPITRQFCRFTIRCATSDWLRRGQNAHCIMGKCRQVKCRAIRNYTWVCFKWPKMWIKRLHAKMHNTIIIYIYYRTIYFKTITCIILIIVISNVFACKTHNVFIDFVDYCVTGKRQPQGGALCGESILIQRFSRAGPRGRGREWATLGVHPLSSLLSNNRLEEVCSTLTKGTFSSRLLLSNHGQRMYP